MLWEQVHTATSFFSRKFESSYWSRYWVYSTSGRVERYERSNTLSSDRGMLYAAELRLE